MVIFPNRDDWCWLPRPMPWRLPHGHGSRGLAAAPHVWPVGPPRYGKESNRYHMENNGIKWPVYKYIYILYIYIYICIHIDIDIDIYNMYTYTYIPYIYIYIICKSVAMHKCTHGWMDGSMDVSMCVYIAVSCWSI